MMLAHYLPTGLLGLGLTALMASSCRAWRATSRRSTPCGPTTSTRPTSGRGRPTSTTCGWATSPPCSGSCSAWSAAYAATRFNNIMDMLQLVFAFVNAPAVRDVPAGHVLEARDRARRVLRAADRDDGRGAAPWARAAAGRRPGIKGGFLGAVLHTYPSEMAQNFWTAIFAWTACFVATIVISLRTKRNKRTRSSRPGLLADAAAQGRGARPGTSGRRRSASLVLGLTLVLNMIFW